MMRRLILFRSINGGHDWQIDWVCSVAIEMDLFASCPFHFWRKMDFIQRDIYPRHWFEYEGSMLRKTQNIDGLKVFMPAEHPEHRLQLDFYRKVFLEKSISMCLY